MIKLLHRESNKVSYIYRSQIQDGIRRCVSKQCYNLYGATYHNKNPHKVRAQNHLELCLLCRELQVTLWTWWFKILTQLEVGLVEVLIFNRCCLMKGVWGPFLGDENSSQGTLSYFLRSSYKTSNSSPSMSTNIRLNMVLFTNIPT